MLLLYGLLGSACANSQDDALETFGGDIFGTTYTIKYAPQDASLQKSVIEQAVTKRLEDIDQVMSTWKKDSEISLVNRAHKNTVISLSRELADILSLSAKLTSDTQGAFDITVGPLVNLWGFSAQGKRERIPSSYDIQLAMEDIGMEKMVINPVQKQLVKKGNLYLDLSAIAKGYAVDEVSHLLLQQGIENHLVEIGGEIKVRGQKPFAKDAFWRVAVETPSEDRRDIYKVIRPRNMGMATSGDYRNYYEQNNVRYSHIIDPITGMPVAHRLASGTVLHEQTAIADAWATALMVLGEKRGFALAQKHSLAAYFIVRQEEGFMQRYTSAFKPLLAAE